MSELSFLASSMRAFILDPSLRALFKNKVWFVFVRDVVLRNRAIFSSFERMTFALSSALS